MSGKHYRTRGIPHDNQEVTELLGARDDNWAKINCMGAETKKNKNLAERVRCDIILDNKQVRLVTTTSMPLLDKIANIHNSKKDTLYLGCSHDTDLVNFLYSKGYRSSMRTYRFWDISNVSWLNTLIKYSWNKVLGKCATIEEALGIENNSEANQFSLEVANNKSNNQEKLYLGYKIIQDGNGYNLVDKSNHKTFGNPVEKIWFDNEKNLYYFKNGKFTYIGTPGHWTKYNIEKNKKRKMNEESKYLAKLIRETLEEIVTEKFNFDNDSIAISPEMNLGLESPLEFE